MYQSPSISASALLNHYNFDLGGFKLEQIVQNWLVLYPPKWVLAAVVEAIYQGRYKAVSVDRILSLWQKRGQRASNFDLEFTDLVCRVLIKNKRKSPRNRKLRNRYQHFAA